MQVSNNVIVLPINRKMDPNQQDPDAGEDSASSKDVLTPLIEAVAAQRDRDAFRQLFQAFAPKVKAYAIKQGMLEHAEELVQEVMVNVWRRAAQFDREKAAASTWLFAIARNARIDLLRKLGRSSQETQVETDYLWSLPGSDEPTGAFQQAVIVRNIRQSLGDLPQEQRDVIAKVYLEDKSHQRVAEELSLPLGTVKSRVRLALQKLKVILQEREKAV
ncbi:sigma-70 family RNA polymerase sigma factor [Hahella sp. HN01]|uniref:sigma-70 family RNA polymerase sigma factor n=1 Tax=Hahella sp. HN01 TaxID=2847262 RepID=UPI001C1E96EF|nr:sigma-70 family RNA polymerase sigma factor [Hahella sp. HN01]MBU6951131.1 sigma-70 family RNA polymerase sigma factor [Hahella sp. HN01]